MTQQNTAQPVPIERLAASYLPPVPGFTYDMYAAPGRLNGTFANLHQMAVATFQDAMLRRAPRATPKSDSEKALLRNVWDAATELLGKGWHDASVPDPLVDPVLMLTGAPDLVAEQPNGDAAQFFLECAFKPFEGDSNPMLYPLQSEPSNAQSRAELRAGLFDAIDWRMRPTSGYRRPYAVIVSPSSHVVEPVNPLDIPAIHAILHSALSIPGRRPNA